MDVGYFLDQQSFLHQVWRVHFSAKNPKFLSFFLKKTFLLLTQNTWAPISHDRDQFLWMFSIFSNLKQIFLRTENSYENHPSSQSEARM